MATANLVALILMLVQALAVQRFEFECFPVRPGTPEGYTALKSRLLHTGAADHLCLSCKANLNGKQQGKAKFCNKACHGKWRFVKRKRR